MLKPKELALLLVSAFLIPMPLRADTKVMGVEDLVLLSLEELLNVQISTPSKSNSNFQNAPGVVSLITRRDIDNMGARSLADVLNNVPGFTVGRSMWLGHHLTLHTRGTFTLSADNILFLLNGQRLNDALTGSAFTFISDYPLDNVKQIEVIRGPGSALYGANAFMGVINIITMTGKDYKKSTRISARKGDNNATYVQAEYGKKISDDLNIALHGSFSDFDNTDLSQKPYSIINRQTGTSRTINNPVNAEASRSYNLGGRIQYQEFDFDMGYQASQYWNTWSSGSVPSMTSKDFRNQFNASLFHTGLKYNKSLSNSLSVKASGSYVSHWSETKLKYWTWPIVFGEVLESEHLAKGDFAYLEYKTDTLNLEASLEWKPLADHVIIAGLSFEKDSLDESVDKTGMHDADGDGFQDTILDSYVPAGKNVIPASSRKVYAIFGQHTWDISDRVRMTTGIRMDDYSDFGKTTNPRIALIFKPSEKLSIKALVGRAFRAPAMTDLHAIRDSTVDFLPNPELDPETVLTYELQFQYKPTKSLLLSSSFFKFNIDDIIRRVSTQNPDKPGQFTVTNSGERTSEGVELELNYRPTNESFSLFANYSYVDATEVLAGIRTQTEGIARQSFNFGVNVDLFNKLTVNVNGNVRTDWTAQTSTPMFGAFKPPTYTILNTRLALRNVVPDVVFTFDVFNLLDSKQYFPILQSFAPTGLAFNGRQFLLGVKYEY
ncbi:TonB-dependent receptor [Candidatus Venteria ishoeyi]|uniref:TonB-dependent receptor plug domain-containing protein n=1 Tax=Candidatus Venteria ishoeyi TaxID=1899563 RepID=UPI0025A64F1A|nr:TonB-dependent receptor [Candidatus Venteria ishoeyi]MDM8546808.1 TonB-dependent receptor [Candidatus Venteria ishoeyi]